MKKTKRVISLMVCVLCCCTLMCACQSNVQGGGSETYTPAPSGTVTASPSVNISQTPINEGQLNDPDLEYCATLAPTESDFVCGLPDDVPTRSTDPTEQTTVSSKPTSAPTVPSQDEEDDPIAIKAGDVYRIFLWDVMEENEVLYRDAWELGRWEEFQQKYGVTVTWIANPYPFDWKDKVLESAYVGQPVADIYNFGTTTLMLDMLFYNGQNQTVSPKSMFEDLSKYGDYADFTDAQYWDQVAAREIGYFGGAQLAVVPYQNGWNDVLNNQVTFFNKKLLEDAGYSAQQIYSLYQNGEWTFDKFREIALACTDEDNGVKGCAIGSNAIAMLSLISANGGRILTPNNDGVQRFTANSNKAVYAMNFFLDMCRQDKSFYTENVLYQMEGELFRDGKVAMMLSQVKTVQDNNRSTGAIYETDGLEYGIVLPPKGPDATDYISDRNDVSAYAVFKGHENMAGVVQCLYYYRAPYYPLHSQEQKSALEFEASAYFSSDDIQTIHDASEKTRVSSYMPYWYDGVDSGMVGSNVSGYVPIWLSGEGNVETNMNSAERDINSIIDRLLDRL